METKIYHGDISPNDFAQALVGEFNQGNLRAHQIGRNREVAVQIGTKQMRRSGGDTAMTVTLKTVEDGVAMQVPHRLADLDQKLHASAMIQPSRIIHENKTRPIIERVTSSERFATR